ncbi:recombinase family protein [Bacteroidales bacterium OttesenSCG-928-B11]|nr:recombinase family protein [Bacteroidales bacterium OttesenSCG-928-B11]MDL2326476.1 recombinase family protein [Bacteroidales bacterium OttesenSCG-928-A14]
MFLGYARVSTKEQNVDLQIDALKKAGAEKIFTDKISAVKERPELELMLDFARSGDTIVVWKLDRIARSLKHLIEIVERLKEKGVGFVSVTEAIDTATPLGQFFLQITGAFAELDRNLIIERTHAGLKAAKERGRVGGRKKGLSKEAEKKAKAVKKIYLDPENTLSMDEICKLFNIGSKATLYRYLRAENVEIKGKKKK